MLSLLSKITNPEQSCQFKLVKDPDSKKVTDLLLNKTIPVTLFDSLLTFRDTNRMFKLQGDLLKIITIKNYNVNLAKSQDRKLMYEFAKEICFDEKA